MLLCVHIIDAVKKYIIMICTGYSCDYTNSVASFRNTLPGLGPKSHAITASQKAYELK